MDLQGANILNKNNGLYAGNLKVVNYKTKTRTGLSDARFIVLCVTGNALPLIDYFTITLTVFTVPSA